MSKMAAMIMDVLRFASSVISDGAAMCILPLVVCCIASVSLDGLTTSHSIVLGVRAMVQFLARAWSVVRNNRFSMPSSAVTQTSSAAPNSLSARHHHPQQYCKHHPLRSRTVTAAAMSDSKAPMGPSAAHSADKAANPNAPHVPSKLSSSFTPASVEENNSKNNNAKSSSKPAPKGADVKSDKPAEGEKLSGAELKKRAKAEKAARRAKERQEREQAAGQLPGGGSKPDDKDKKKADMAAQKKPGRMAVAPLPVPESKKKKEPVNEKVYALFAHLSDHLRKANMDTAGKDVHPRILTLGSQIANYELLGSAVRCTAMLLAFKEVCLLFFACLTRWLITAG